MAQCLFNEFLCVIALVRPKGHCCDLSRGLPGIDHHRLGGLWLGTPVCGGDHRAGNQSVADVAERVPHEAKLAGRVAMAVQPRIGIGAGLVCVLAAALAFEIARTRVLVVMLVLVVCVLGLITAMSLLVFGAKALCPAQA